jgi:hypothetical protein
MTAPAYLPPLRFFPAPAPIRAHCALDHASDRTENVSAVRTIERGTSWELAAGNSLNAMVATKA